MNLAFLDDNIKCLSSSLILKPVILVLYYTNIIFSPETDQRTMKLQINKEVNGIVNW